MSNFIVDELKKIKVGQSYSLTKKEWVRLYPGSMPKNMLSYWMRSHLKNRKFSVSQDSKKYYFLRQSNVK